MTAVEVAWLRLQLLLGEHREVEQRAELARREEAFLAVLAGSQPAAS